MSAINRRRLWFFGVLLGVLVFIQSPALEWLLRVFTSRAEAATRASDIRDNSPGLVIAFIIAFYWDIVRGRLGDIERAAQLDAIADVGRTTVNQIEKQVTRLAETITTEPLERTSERDLIRAALRRKLGSTPISIENLVTMVVGREDAPHILGCEIRHVLKDNRDNPSYFSVERDQTARIDLRQYVLALTATDVANEWVAYDCPLVFDTWHVGGRESLKVNRELHLERTWISYLDPTRDFTRSRRVQLAEIPRSEWAEYLGPESGDFVQDLVMLRAEIPVTNDPITIHTETLLPIETNYCFWAADCPTFVELISFDVAGLITAHPANTVYSLVPFLGCTTDLQSGTRPVRFETRPHNWLVKGQGAILTWQSEKGSEP